MGKTISFIADLVRKVLLRATCRAVVFHQFCIAAQRNIVCDMIQQAGRFPEQLNAPLTT
jgi:hypothetical protein